MSILGFVALLWLAECIILLPFSYTALIKRSITCSYSSSGNRSSLLNHILCLVIFTSIGNLATLWSYLNHFLTYENMKTLDHYGYQPLSDNSQSQYFSNKPCTACIIILNCKFEDSNLSKSCSLSTLFSSLPRYSLLIASMYLKSWYPIYLVNTVIM